MSRCRTLFVAAFVAFSSLTAVARTIKVPGDFPTIQAGIDAASDGDEVVIAPGVYCETVDFEGKAITVRSMDPSDSNVVAATVVNPLGQGHAFEFEHLEGPSSVLAGFTIIGGYGTNGGAVFVDHAGPRIQWCVFRQNVADRGSALYGDQTSVQVSNCTFELGSATIGGAVYLVDSFDGSLHFSACTFHLNTAYKGGAIGLENSGALFENCLIVSNGAGSRGGAAWLGASNPEFRNCTIADNNTEGEAGGFYLADYCSPQFQNVIVWGNQAEQIVASSKFSDPTATYCDVQGGWTLGYGKNNIDADPMFRSYRGFDYVLGLGSPAIDAGDPSIEDGLSDSHPKWPNWYPNDSRSDMGAYGGPNNRGWLN